MAGWCAGNCVRLAPRERLFCMMAASLADLDGLGIIVGQNAYWAGHHKLGHNLTFGLLLAVILVCFSTHRVRAFVMYVAMFHLHLLMDYYGSGPNWGFYYLWPFSNMKIECPTPWNLFSWQNITAAGVLLAWTILIAIFARRTPLEAVHAVAGPAVDTRKPLGGSLALPAVNSTASSGSIPAQWRFNRCLI